MEMRQVLLKEHETTSKSFSALAVPEGCGISHKGILTSHTSVFLYALCEDGGHESQNGLHWKRT